MEPDVITFVHQTAVVALPTWAVSKAVDGESIITILLKHFLHLLLRHAHVVFAITIIIPYAMKCVMFQVEERVNGMAVALIPVWMHTTVNQKLFVMFQM